MNNVNSKNKVINIDLIQYNAMILVETKKNSEEEKFNEEIKNFEKIDSIEEARLFAAKILPPMVNGINRFYIGNIKCIVINKKDLFRICVDSEKEFLCFEY